MTKRTLLTLTVAALFAVSSSSAFSILQSSSRSPATAIRSYESENRIEQHNNRLSAAVAATAPKRSRATTLLLVTPLLDDSNSNDAVEEKVTLGKRLHNWKCWIQFWRNTTVRNLSGTSISTTRRNHRAARVVATSLISAGSIVGVMGGFTPAPVFARTLQDTMEEGTQIYSLRPGVSMEQAEQLSSGVMPDEVRDNIDSKSAVGVTTGFSKEESVAKAKKQDTLYGDYGDYDDEDYAADEEEFGEGAYKNSVAPSKQRQKSFSSDTDVSNEISKATKTVFSGISSDSKTTKPSSLYMKISLACFVPTFGLFGARDFVRSKEEQNIKKATEIVDAPRAEYFGIDKDGKAWRCVVCRHIGFSFILRIDRIAKNRLGLFMVH